MSCSSFAFLDETGTLAPGYPEQFYAVGAIIDNEPDEMIIALHTVLEELSSFLRKDPSRLEMKFSNVTKTTTHIYEKAIQILNTRSSWRFCSLIVDRKDPDFIHPKTPQEQWSAYIRFTKLLLQHNIKESEQIILLADYYRQPSGRVVPLCKLPQMVQHLIDTLQVESYGILPIQMTDILLGASFYKGGDHEKLRLVRTVQKLQKDVGKKRWNEWRIRWV